MISLADLRTLEKGDVIEAGSVFGGMTKEPLKLMVAAIQAEPFQLTAVGSLFGVHVGEWQVTIEGDKANWRRLTPILAGSTIVTALTVIPPGIEEDAA